MRERTYYVYILSSFTGTLYVGVTSNLIRRIDQHRNKCTQGFTEKYNVDRLMYYETYGDVRDAIEREKQIKKWSRVKKENLIDEMNEERRNLSADF